MLFKLMEEQEQQVLQVPSLQCHWPLRKLLKQGVLTENPIKDYLAAISCGIINTKIFMDLDYDEDSNADVDANFIFAKKIRYI